ncbi:TPA: hypothetical protein N3A34_004683 [Salmonella enterica subsp. houtenae serovar 43:z4,z23:-]|nr:hypothetical protein [Salmonella enterica subsp. houtenae serovar Houten]
MTLCQRGHFRRGPVCTALVCVVDATSSLTGLLVVMKFFDRVNHDILMDRLARRYLQAGIMADGVVMACDEGTPQGGSLSPLLANVLLDEVDRALQQRDYRFQRSGFVDSSPTPGYPA